MRDTFDSNATDSLHSRPAVGAVVLAAGAAERIGRRPKCLLELDGEPLIRRLLRALAGAGIGDIVVVLGHYADPIAAAIRDCPAALVHNPDPDAGQGTSLHCGLRALPQSPAVLVALADQPLLDAADIGELLRAFAGRPSTAAMTVPAVDGLPGNPVVFETAVGDEILARDATFGGRQWQAANPERVFRWPAPNTHYRIDIDTPADLDSFAARTGRHLRWPD